MNVGPTMNPGSSVLALISSFGYPLWRVWDIGWPRVALENPAE